MFNLVPRTVKLHTQVYGSVFQSSLHPWLGDFTCIQSLHRDRLTDGLTLTPKGPGLSFTGLMSGLVRSAKIKPYEKEYWFSLSFSFGCFANPLVGRSCRLNLAISFVSSFSLGGESDEFWDLRANDDLENRTLLLVLVQSRYQLIIFFHIANSTKMNTDWCVGPISSIGTFSIFGKAFRLGTQATDFWHRSSATMQSPSASEAIKPLTICRAVTKNVNGDLYLTYIRRLQTSFFNHLFMYTSGFVFFQVVFGSEHVCRFSTNLPSMSAFCWELVYILNCPNVSYFCTLSAKKTHAGVNSVNCSRAHIDNVVILHFRVCRKTIIPYRMAAIFQSETECRLRSCILYHCPNYFKFMSRLSVTAVWLVYSDFSHLFLKRGPFSRNTFAYT